ncbi:MAG: helix-turn-helix transcriptional regulator [Hyphomonadaceae bacterium]|jgi:DNA-binding CsgD family transcriptional regulator
MQSSSVTRATELLESSLFTPDDLPHTLEAVAREIGFDHFCLVHAELDNLTFIASELSLDALNAYADGGWREVDYRAANVNQTPDGQLFLDHLAVPDESRTRSAIYNELYVPNRMAYFAGWRFAIDGDTWIYSLARAEDKGPAGLADVDMLTRLAPFANRALLMARHLRDVRVGGMLSGLASANLAALILDSDGKAQAVTPSAQSMLGSEIDIRSGSLWASDSSANEALGQLARRARNGLIDGLTPDIVIRRPDGRKPILIQPIPVRGVGLDALPGARILVMLTDLEANTAATAAELECLFDLSHAESHVAALLGQGYDPSEIARRRNVAVDTVRGQLKSIFRKLGAGRQSDVVSLLARLPASRRKLGHPD